jgi:hypothetical protein
MVAIPALGSGEAAQDAMTINIRVHRECSALIGSKRKGSPFSNYLLASIPGKGGTRVKS